MHPDRECVLEDIWQEYHLATDEPYLLKQIYWTDSKLVNSENIFVDDDLRPELHEWDDEIKFEIDIGSLARYPAIWLTPKSDGDDGLRYTVWARLRVKVFDLQVSISWDIAPPNFRWSKSRGL